MDYVSVLDTTLRDGEQAPGIAFSEDEKIAVAAGLADLGTTIIEAGFPASSDAEHDAVAHIAGMLADRNPDCTVTALSRCAPKDIAATADALRPGATPRLHLVLSTSERHRRAMHAGLDDAELLALAGRSVAQARALVPDVQFSAQDASRSDPEFLAAMARTVRDSGGTVFNVCDTVGYAVPGEFGELVAGLVGAVPELTYSVHCHDDLGLAVANSLAGLLAGARQVEVAMNGLGERAGNCAYEEMAMLLRTRGPALGLQVALQVSGLARVSALVADVSGYPIAPNKAVVGANAFRHESGMHQHGVMLDRQTYEVIRAEDVGRIGGEIVLGKHSGKHALRAALEASQIHVEEDRLPRLLELVKAHPQHASDLRKLADMAP